MFNKTTIAAVAVLGSVSAFSNDQVAPTGPEVNEWEHQQLVDLHSSFIQTLINSDVCAGDENMGVDGYESNWCRMMRSGGLAHVRAMLMYVANDSNCTGEEFELACQQVGLDGALPDVNVNDDGMLH